MTDTNGSIVQQVGVWRVPCSGPGDLSAVQVLIDSGDVIPSDIVAVMGKTEGNGCVNDFTREYAAAEWCRLLSPYLSCTPAAVHARVALVMSGGTEGVLSPHFTVFSRRWLDVPDVDTSLGKRLVIGIAQTRDFLPEEIGRPAQIDATALAVKAAMQKHKLPGTIRLYGTPAEETLIGKVYMTLDGQFDDLDVCLHWHPSDKNEAWASSSKAVVSAKFTFHGTPSHASVSPEAGKSALDAVELMNVAANFMREHVKEDARIHYVITDGGGQPNVVPPKATVWYFVRSDQHQDVEHNFRWLLDIAKGAALMTRTRFDVQYDTDCHEIISNGPLSDLITENLERVGAPKFNENEQTFARRLQEPLVAELGTSFPLSIDERVHRATPASKLSKGSTDVGDISWRIPTGGLKTSCFPADSPGHSWQNVASIGSTIGEKGTLYAAKVLA